MDFEASGLADPRTRDELALELGNLNDELQRILAAKEQTVESAEIEALESQLADLSQQITVIEDQLKSMPEDVEGETIGNESA